MPDLKISQLPVASATTGAELFPVVQGGVTKQLALNNIQQLGTLSSLAVSGVTTLQAGTALLPALTTTGDPNTGVFFPAADTVAVTTGGTERVRVWSNGDLRLTTASAAFLFASSSGTVSAGIQLDAANTRIDVLTAGTQRWRFTSTGHLVAFVDNTYDIGASGATRPRDLFLGRDLAVSGNIIGSGQVTGTTDTAGNFGVNIRARASDNIFSVLQFSNNAGTTRYAAILAVNTPELRFTVGTGNDQWRMNSSGHFIATTDNTVDIGASGATRPRTVYVGTEVVTPAVKFPATQVASADANTLDDYEEGTWTPGFSFGGGTTGITYNGSFTGGSYTKIGRLVVVFGTITLTAKGASTGTAQITGLPFSLPNSYLRLGSASMLINNITFTGQTALQADLNATTITFYQTTEAGVRSVLTDTNFANNSDVQFTLSYMV